MNSCSESFGYKVANRIRLTFLLLLVGLYCTSQSDTANYYLDSLGLPKKEFNVNSKFDIGLSLHEYDLSYRINFNTHTAQVETASCVYVGYQYIDNNWNFGGVMKKGFHLSFSQPPGHNQRTALSFPWIMEVGGGGNLFFFRKREFFLGPVISYSILYDGRYDIVHQLVGYGFLFRKKWFSFRVNSHKFISSNNTFFPEVREESFTYNLGLVIPVYRVKEIVKNKRFSKEPKS